MWRTGVFIVTTVLVQLISGDVENAADSLLIQRLKRSPQYDNCGSYYPPPPPPPPPFWPPPHRHPRYWGPPPPPPPPPFWPPPPPPQSQPQTINVDVYSSANAQANAAAPVSAVPVNAVPANAVPVDSAPCSTCGDNGQSNAISNAQSDTGQAIAVAISKANSH